MNEVLSVYRSENKYYITTETALNIRKKLDLILNRDDFSKENSYIVRSLYFDSFNNIDFNTKLAGTEIRKKIRIRVYDSASEKCKLEVKEKNGDAQHKISIWITKQDAIDLTLGKYNVLMKYFEKNKEAIKIYTTMILGCYKPVVMVEYDRIAYTHPLYNTRITLDMNVRSSESNFNLFDQNILYTPIMENSIILEVKYNGKLIELISDVLKNYHLTKISVSKYCFSRKIFYDFNF